MKNPFSLNGKIMKQTPNQFTIIKSIIIIHKFMPNLRFTKYNNKSSFVCLTVKENLLVFFTLTHTNYLSQRRQHFYLSSLFSSPLTSLSLSWLSSFSSMWLFLTNSHSMWHTLDYSRATLLECVSSLSFFTF